MQAIRYQFQNYFFIVMLLLSSCNKDAAVQADAKKNCSRPRPCNPSFIFREGPVQRTKPFYNPNNSNEFIFLQKDSNQITTIKKGNLANGLAADVLKRNNITDPIWCGIAPYDWIVFIDFPEQSIYKVKPDGSNLTKIISASDRKFFKLLYLPKEGQIMVNANMNNIDFALYYDLSGNLYDSIVEKPFNVATVCPSIEFSEVAYNDFSTPYRSAISIKKAKGSTYLTYIPQDKELREYGSLFSLSWHPNAQDVYFTYDDNIYKLNKNSYSLALIKDGCAHDAYQVLQVSPDGTKMLAEVVSWYYDKDCNHYFNTDLVVMDIDGRNERKVFQ